MLLRSITKHIQQQNWPAVLLDLFVVILGVFIGIQVSNWNAERAERDLEAVYIERLHHEVVNLENVRQPNIRGRVLTSNDLESMVAKLFDPQGADLSSTECYFLADNPYTTNPTDNLPLVIELLSSGRLTIFTNEQLENALGNFLIIRERARDASAGLNARTPNLFNKHSELIEVKGSIRPVNRPDPNTVSPEERIDSRDQVVCDEARLRASQIFLNDLSRFDLSFYHHIQINQSVSDALKEMHNVLDDLLEIEH